MRPLLFSLILSVNSYAKDTLNKQIGNYEVVVKWNESLESERVIVKNKGKIVYQEGEPGSHYWIGNHFDDSLKGEDALSGKDLTGNGVSDIIISQWNGGAHCCNILTIFELRENKFLKLFSIDGGSNGFEIRDLDKDKIPEIIFWDWPIDYLFNCFADSAQGRVVLKFINGQYRVANNLMYRRRPVSTKLTKIKAEIRKKFNGSGNSVPYELLNIMMQLNYTGYKDLAMQIAKETWPKKRSDFNKFNSEFREALSDSVYWTEFNKKKY